MNCPNCNDSRLELICSNCGFIASVSISDNGNIFEWCDNCDRKGLEYYIEEVPCRSCHNKKSNEYSHQKFSAIFESVLAQFKKDYGEIKLKKIWEKLFAAKNVNITLSNFEKAKVPPKAIGIISMLNSVIYFAFGPQRNIAIGGAIFIDVWNKRCNGNNEIISENELINLLEDLFIKTLGDSKFGELIS
jgi:hypothetical protein